MPRFTYGAQFSPDQTPLSRLLSLLSPSHGSREALQRAIQTTFFAAKNDSWTLAGNCSLSLNAYKIIENIDKERFQITNFGQKLIEALTIEKEMYRLLAIHILVHLEGLILLHIIERMRTRGEQITLETIGDELNEIDIDLSTNSPYISTMRGWLEKAGVFGKGYEIRWDIVDGLVGVGTDTIADLYKLNVSQKYFLLSMAQLGAIEFMPSNSVAHHARNFYLIKITTKNLVKDVLEPLSATGLIESTRATEGRGARPHLVRLTSKGNKELLVPLLENIAKVSGIEIIGLNMSFEQVIAELKDESIYKKGVALELLAIWIIRLLGLRFTGWRLKSSAATGGGEVDVMAASDKIVYSRWQIQCKNTTKNVDIDTVAKEVGMSFKTKADIILIITTAGFTSAASEYSNQVSNDSRYYVILLDGKNIAEIAKDRSKIVDIFNEKARRVFARRELGIND